MDIVIDIALDEDTSIISDTVSIINKLIFFLRKTNLIKM